MKVYTLKIDEKRFETEDTITLSFKQPGLKKIKYKAGQYLTLIFRINGRRYIRPYSFSSAPAVDSHLEVTIKRVPNGIVSNHIHDVVKVGDSVEVMQPMGDFVCEQSDAQVFLWGVGSGITPLISIAKQMLASSALAKIILVYGNRNYESTIFLNQIESLKSSYPKQFFTRHFFTKLVISSENNDLVEGRIDKKNALKIVSETTDFNSALHYICGPSGLKESVKTALNELNINDQQIFSEDFELVKNPADFEDIHTQNIRLTYKNEEYNLEVVKGKTILESALDAGIELPYSCQTGNCDTCKGKLAYGALKMIGLTKDRGDLGANEYLLCCSHPISNNVYIEI